ncbi:hypothetical protein Hdeb2414_s0020g00559701 [Helianthus debilis subsp. tardiflorus]
MRLVPSDGDGLEWDDSQIPFTVGYENGDHDLASSVLKFKGKDIILMRDTGFVKDHRDEACIFRS